MFASSTTHATLLLVRQPIAKILVNSISSSGVRNHNLIVFDNIVCQTVDNLQLYLMQSMPGDLSLLISNAGFDP